MHCSYELTESTAKAMGLKLVNKPEKCVAYTVGKTKVKPTDKINKNRSKIPGERLYVDTSSVRDRFRGGSKFWLMIADDATSKKWSSFLKKRMNSTKSY